MLEKQKTDTQRLRNKHSMIALVVRKLSIGSGTIRKPTIIMSGDLRIDLQAKAAKQSRTVYPSGSPTSPPGLSSFLPTISSRFNVGKSKDPSSSSGGSKKKKKSAKNSSTSAIPPAQGKPASALRG